MAVKLRLVFSITILFLSFCGSAQSTYWRSMTAMKASTDSQMKRLEVRQGLLFSLGEANFLNELKGLTPTKKNSKTIYFPDDQGKLVGFNVKETPVMAAELSARYPQIRSYTGSGITNAADKVRFSVSQNGLQAMIVHGNGKGNTFMQKVDKNDYVVYKRDTYHKKDVNFICNTTAKVENRQGASTLKPVNGQVLRKFRLAVSTTGEYAEYHGGTVADALAAVNATVTRVNQIFESDLAITLELIANTDSVIFTDSDTDPYGINLSGQAQNTFTDSIGPANYDIGHLFHRDQANGNAGFVGAVCVDNRKGSAFSSHPDPIGDFYDLDYVAHEMGHQFGANHTWSFEPEGTTVQVEPGSGTTIMGYAGIANQDNVALSGEDYFHYSSIVQIADYLETVSCAEVTILTNNPPVIVPASDFIIPKSTAFALTGNASDPDVGDVLSYAWEQIDNGIVTQATFGPTNPSGANFRSQRPTVDPVRYFPKLSSVISGNLTQVNPVVNSAWETVSDVEREMNFALTVRDNAIGGGQVEADQVKVTVVNSAGPFMVTSQTGGESYVAGAVQQIMWDVANTYDAPVNAETVDILLSIDGGVTFPTIMATNVPNDGEHKVIVPGAATTEARIMVKASDNIFFAVNAGDYTIIESEVVLNFSELEFDVCQPNIITTSFDYETYLGFNEEVTFSVFSAPANLIVTFTPPTATASTTIDMDISGTENVLEGDHQVVVLATSPTISKMVALDITIFDSTFTDVALTSPADAQLDVSVIKAELQWENNPTYTSYDLEIATDVAFTNIIESATLSDSSYSPRNLQYESTYFWRVKPINLCGEGTFGNPFSFTTIELNCANKSAVGFPVEISSVGTPTVMSKIAFFEDLTLADLNVNLDIDHTYLSDLVVSLTSPAGTTVVLLSSSCEDLQNVNATFDDGAPDFNCSGDPAIEGTVKPLGSLSSFNGESILGEWTLQIVDNFSSDGGAINGFSFDVCIEGELRPDADKDGVFDDGDDLCLGTPEGSLVDSSGCPVSIFPVDNFSLSLQSESCRGNNDGLIEIEAALSLDYEITAIGVGLNTIENFTDTYTLSDLSSGTYNICISGTDGALTYQEHCFELTITEPEPLGVGSKISNDGKSVILTLQGAASYNIELNGILTKTESPEITFDFKPGVNTLKVFTDLPCQGIHEEVFFRSNEPVVFPNPTHNYARVFLAVADNVVDVEIFSEAGRFIRKENHIAVGSEIEIDLTGLSSGIYYVRFKGSDVKWTSKVIKL